MTASFCKSREGIIENIFSIIFTSTFKLSYAYNSVTSIFKQPSNLTLRSSLQETKAT